MSKPVSAQWYQNSLLTTIVLLWLCIFSVSGFCKEPPIEDQNSRSLAWAEATNRAYRPITEADIATSRQVLLAAIQAANQVLDAIPTGGVIRRETELSELRDELLQDSRDVSVFQRRYRLIARKVPQEAEATIDTVRTQLWKHIGKLEWFALTDSENYFQLCVENLRVAMMLSPVPSDLMASAEQSYGWLAKSGMIDSQLKEVRKSLSHPNEYIRLRNSFVKNLLPSTISKSIPIDQKGEKVRLRGQANVQANVDVEFVPNQKNGELRLRIAGTGDIPITASINKADVHARSKLQLLGTLGINVTSRGVKLGDDEVCVQNKLKLQDVCLHLRSRILSKALNPLATCVLKRLLPKADEKIEEKIKEEVSKQLNDSGLAAVVQLNAILNQVLWETVDARDVDTQSVVWTTADELVWREEAILPTTLGAPSLPPGFGPLNPPLQIQLHDSALNNTSVVLCRRSYNEVLFREIIYDTLGLKPLSELDSQGGRIPAVFTFASEDPLRARFQNNTIELQIRIQNFEWENRSYEGTEYTATIRYAVHHQGDSLLLEQIGQKEIVPQSAEASILRRVLDRFLVEKAQLGESRSFDGKDSKIHVVHVTLQNGWLQVGVDSGASAVETGSEVEADAMN